MRTNVVKCDGQFCETQAEVPPEKDGTHPYLPVADGWGVLITDDGQPGVDRSPRIVLDLCPWHIAHGRTRVKVEESAS